MNPAGSVRRNIVLIAKKLSPNVSTPFCHIARLSRAEQGFSGPNAGVRLVSWRMS
jgi:hypothetical protein